MHFAANKIALSYMHIQRAGLHLFIYLGRNLSRMIFQN